jgi:hypothetical protein
MLITAIDFLFDIDDDHAEGARLRLWTAAAKELLFIPRWYMSMKNHGGIIPTGKNCWFVLQIFLAILPWGSSTIKSEGTVEVNYEYCLTKYLFRTSKGSLTWLKILWYWANEDVLLIFIALKNISPTAGFECENLWSDDKHAYYSDHRGWIFFDK